MRLSADEVWDDVVFLGYHLHWQLDALLDLEHPDRRRLVAGVSRLNERSWAEVRAHEAGR